MSDPLDPYLIQHPDAGQWTISRLHHDRRIVFVRPDGSTSVPRWIVRIRKLLPGLEGRTPAELLNSVRQSGGLDLGVLSGRDAQYISQLLIQTASIVEVTDASCISHFAKVDGEGLIIGDDAKAQSLCLQLIELGARVENIED